MTFEIELASGTCSISVRRGSGRDQYVVTIDGRPFDVEARRSSDLAFVISTMNGVQQPGGVATDKTNGPKDFRSSQEVRHVFVTPAGAPGELLVTFDGRTAAVRVNGRSRRPTDTLAHADGDLSVTAPMPGRVVRVLVAAGDEVSAGQGVVVVEAMKMENELRAPRTGKVKDVNVSAGTSVEAGKVLVVIE